MFLFAYGSLRNARSRQLTLGDNKIETFDALLDGSLSNYMLDFCYRCEKWNMSCLGLHVVHTDVVDEKKRKQFIPDIQGTILKVDENMIKLLDTREAGYERRFESLVGTALLLMRSKRRKTRWSVIRLRSPGELCFELVRRFPQ